MESIDGELDQNDCYRPSEHHSGGLRRGPQLIPNHVNGFKNHYWNQRITPRFFIRNHNMLLKVSNFLYTLNHVTHNPYLANRNH